jgi:hypothetical protein
MKVTVAFEAVIRSGIKNTFLRALRNISTGFPAYRNGIGFDKIRRRRNIKFASRKRNLRNGRRNNTARNTFQKTTP